MRNSIYSFAFFTLIGLSLSACETTKAAESTTSAGPGNAANKNVAVSNASKPAAEPSQVIAPIGAPVASKALEPSLPLVIKPEQLFTEGRELYEKGDYRGAIRKLTSARDGADDAPVVKKNSLKYLAFSYCVTSQRPLCKAQFSSLLKLSPSFELSRGEAGHPLWGPVFKEAKTGAVKSSK
jgi:hypothetical protein